MPIPDAYDFYGDDYARNQLDLKKVEEQGHNRDPIGIQDIN